MKIAITYQHSLELGGSERVLEVLAAMYPTADFFCMLADPKAIPPGLRGRSITTSWMNRLPGARRFYSYLQFLGPLAAETMDLSEYDLVISSDGSHTMGVLTRQDALHICYCHSPHRSLWDSFHSYRKTLKGPVQWIFTLSSHYVRQCNFFAAQRVDFFVANSAYVAERIRKFYGRDSEIIFAPVDSYKGYLADGRDDYYLSVGRLWHAKRIDLLIEACNALGRRLVIAGTGPEERTLRQIAGPTIEFVGRVSEEQLSALYSRTRALLFASEEDFGIVPIEAQSYGAPVIAFGRGGAVETVRPLGASSEPTGVFFSDRTATSLQQAILRFEAAEHTFDPESIRNHALTFDTSCFIKRFGDFVASRLAQQEKAPGSRGLDWSNRDVQETAVPVLSGGVEK